MSSVRTHPVRERNSASCEESKYPVETKILAWWLVDVLIQMVYTYTRTVAPSWNSRFSWGSSSGEHITRDRVSCEYRMMLGRQIFYMVCGGVPPSLARINMQCKAQLTMKGSLKSVWSFTEFLIKESESSMIDVHLREKITNGFSIIIQGLSLSSLVSKRTCIFQ